MSEKEKRKWNNFKKLAIAYTLLIMAILVIDYWLPEKNVVKEDKPCAIVNGEIMTMSECYDIMLNGL